MKRFFVRLSLLALSVMLVFGVLMFGVPKDNNAYLCEYPKKVELIKATPQPRLLLIGGSTLSFGIDSKRISDSLHLNVANLSLHAGMGIRYPLEDFLQYAQKGDWVGVQVPYVDFNSGGNGSPEAMPALMVATNGRNFSTLNRHQIGAIIEGIPFFCYGNLIRLIKSPFKGFDTVPSKDTYLYVASGFNQYGDEASHWNLSPGKVDMPKAKPYKKKKVDEDLMCWLVNIIRKYEEKGCNVLLLPEMSSETAFTMNYFPSIETALNRNGLKIISSPDALVVNDSCIFNGPGHLNKQGVDIVTERLISLLRDQGVTVRE